MSAPRQAGMVSVVIPCWNGEAYLEQALDSVLAQGHAPLEIIVCDDGSSDRSVAIALEHAPVVRVLEQEHEGAAAARNRAVASARGEWLAFLDADDLWTPGRLARMLAALEQAPWPDLVLGRTEQFVTPEIEESMRSRFQFDPGPIAARLSGALIVRHDAFERVGNFSTHLATGEFVDWYLRAEELGLTSRVLEDLVLRRRLHGRNHGVVRQDARQDYLTVIRAALHRRRGTAGTS